MGNFAALAGAGVGVVIGLLIVAWKARNGYCCARGLAFRRTARLFSNRQASSESTDANSRRPKHDF